MIRHTILALTVSLISYQTAHACGGGGGTAFAQGGIKSWATKISTVTYEYTIGRSRAVFSAIASINKYREYVKEREHTEESHRAAAYLWGYEVGDPVVVGTVRSFGEYGQFGSTVFVRSARLPKEALPREFQWDSLTDSIVDVHTAVQGAKDRQQGQPSMYGDIPES